MFGSPQADASISAQLRGRWQLGSNSTGWSFPSDWHVPAVDAVCDMIVAGEDVWPAAMRLGRNRAASGVSLGEALADVDALAELVPTEYVEPLRRGVSMGWADRITAPPASISDPLSGLVSIEYLNIRLGEVYRAAEVGGTEVSDGSVLLVARLDLAKRTGWQRTLPMILAAEAMRSVFDGGQTLAQLGESVAVVLAAREPMLARRARLLAGMINSHIQRDPQARIPDPHVWIENLPTRYAAALALVAELGR